MKEKALTVGATLCALSILVPLNLHSILSRYTPKTVPWKPWSKPTYTVPLKGLEAPEPRSVAFLVMTSSVTKELFLYQHRSWMRGLRHVWAFSDEYDGLFVETFPSIYGKKTYMDAQHRQLRGIQWLHTHPEKIRGVEWFFLIDDDTWVNMPVFSRIVPLLESNASLLCGYVTGNTMLNGGAGMLMSRKAFDTIARYLYSDTCPFMGVNDDTLTACARRCNITVMHSGLFSFYPSMISSAGDFVDRITVHPVKDPALADAMTATSRELYG